MVGMEALVGRAVRKAFPGFGVYRGVVESYDAEAGYFRVLYDDGDAEEVDMGEMAAILVGPPPPLPARPQPPWGAADDGRRPKKRRRGEGEEEFPEKGSGDGDGPATPADWARGEANGEVVAETTEKRRRVGALPESSRPLRRSARQAKAAELAAEMEAAVAADEGMAAEAEGEVEADASATPQQSGKKSRRANGSVRYRSVARDLEDAAVNRLPPKPSLPPSSQGLDLEGLPVLDVFQVYSCLRSFSRQLFLSPFLLETFVVALRCTYVNPLIDWLHFTLLRSLKGHLEELANEGDPSAIHCIRNLNWELLDLATWPVYLAEYLLARGSELRFGMKLTDIKLLSSEYYRQPARVKLELLRSLCDDVLEIEAIRSELGARMSESDGNDEGFRSTGLRRKKRGSSVRGQAGSSLPAEGSDDVDDGNSDECYLCGMEGNLLCCDGCPAAFHSKCVGVVEDLLPEGDWYCPECLVQKNQADGYKNKAKPVRGAEVLGNDPHDRLYFGTCGYLLVVESCDADSPCQYYGLADLHSLVTVLTSSHHSYKPIVNAISLFWGISIDPSSFNVRYEISKECSTSDHEKDCKKSPLKQHTEYERYKIEKYGSCEKMDSEKAWASNPKQLDQDTSHQKFTMSSALTSDNDNETIADKKLNQSSQHSTSSVKNDECNFEQDGACLYSNGSSAENQKDLSPQKKTSGHLYSDPARYINYYSFGQIAASAAEEIKQKLSENKEAKKPGQDAVSFHLICKKYASIFASTDQRLSVELLKEKCGWCNCCQISGGGDCIFRVIDGKRMESPKPHAIGLQSEKNMESHLVLAMHSILSIEERLNGLLSGPWQNQQYSICWRKAVLKASNVSSLKQPLLTLESNLRRITFSGEWQKPADSVEVVGSAAHILVRSSNKSSIHGSVKKPGRKPFNGELKVDSKDVGVYWWRGGTLSRQVFHWKRLPQSLAQNAARQAGRKKIPSILYSDGSEFARRFKYIAWRAAVEMAENVAQLILQIKELELNIKWVEILSTLPPALATKESQRITRLFKKVIIRRKRMDGTNVEYLLDFGKRENIPPVVVKHGIKFEEPSNDRNRYWLSEGHVPLSLLKAYEAKALTRTLKKKDTDQLPQKTSGNSPKKKSSGSSKKKKMNDSQINETTVSKPKQLKEAVFDYLLERAKKLATRLCGQCKEEVKSSEAVNCQYCAALFHKKHFKVPRGGATTVYVCNKCLDEKVLPMKSPEEEKAVSKKTSPKKKQKKLSRKIITRTQRVVKLRKKTSMNKGKRGRPRKNPLGVSKNYSLKMHENEPLNEPAKRISKRLYYKYMKGNSDISEHTASCRKRKRTAYHHPYWLDGLRWIQNPDDERAWSFRKERVLFPSEDVEISEASPVCCLCEKCYSGDDIYITCETCEDWFHGDIYSVTLENVDNLIDFKCHRCRLRGVPVCHYAQTSMALNDQSYEGDNSNNSRSTEKELNDCNYLKELVSNRINMFDSHLKELDDNSNLNELDSHMGEEEFAAHNFLNELDRHNNVEKLDNQHSHEDLDAIDNSKFTAGETQCLEELGNLSLEDLDDLNSLMGPDNHSCPKELDNHEIANDLDHHKSSKEFGTSIEDIEFSAVTHANDFLDEQFNIRISAKEAPIMTSESDPIKESIVLQSKDSSEENSVLGEPEVDLQVVVTL